MSAKLEFFFDYVSPYTYLANSQLEKMDAEIVYRPMFLGGVMNATGNKPPMQVPARGDYLKRDVHRWASHYAVRFNWPTVFPQNTVNALRAAIVAMHQGKQSAVHQPLFDAIWVHGKDLGDDTVLATIIADAGLSPEEVLEEIKSDTIKNELRANSDEAVERGAFGAPTFFVGDEMFFGNDRFDFIEKALRK